MKLSPTHDQDVARLHAWAEENVPSMRGRRESDPDLYESMLKCQIAHPDFPDDLRYLFMKPMTSLQMEERAEYLENMGNFSRVMRGKRDGRNS